jgi:lipopolysaccharide export system protein LptC
MSVATMVFNRNFAKVIFALAIPASIGYFFWYSQQQANIEVEKYKQEQKNNPTSDSLVIQNYGMKEVDDGNHLRWELTAESGQMMPDGKNVRLDGVVVQYFDPTTKAMKMRLKAPVGLANQETKFVKLEGKDGKKVLAEGEAGKCKFVCDAVELSKKNQFTATGGVIIEWSGVAKVSGNSATGSTNMAAGPKDFKVVGNTHAEIAVR